jgi:multicomponent Na+:H+ antiporter subunit D
MNIFSSNLPFLPIAITLISSCICLLLPKNYMRYIAIIATSVAFIFASMLLFELRDHDIIYSFGGWKAPIGIEYKIDHLNIILLLIILLVGLASLIYAHDLEGKSYPIFLLAIAGFSGMALSNDIFNIYVFMEIASIASYILVVHDANKNSAKSSFNYLVIGTIATSFILLGIGLLYIQTGTLNFSDLHQKTQILSRSIPIISGCLLIILGLLIKIGIFPFSAWLIDVYSNAPSSVVSFFMGAANKLYIYLILKIIATIFVPESYLKYLMYISLASIIVASIAAYRAASIALLTYSSIVQLSYIILLISISYNTDRGLVTIFIAMINHALVKASLVMLLCGDYIRNKSTKFLLFVNLASLAGLPFTLGFIVKWQLLVSLVSVGAWIGFVIVVLSSFIFIFYYYRIWEEFSKVNTAATNNKILPITIVTTINILLVIYSNPLTIWIK